MLMKKCSAVRYFYQLNTNDRKAPCMTEEQLRELLGAFFCVILSKL